jgi:hypothetical protein
MLQSNKAGGGKDDLVYEMVQGLPLCFVSVFWRLFDARFRGEVFEDIESWRWLLLTFLPKERNPTALKDFRGICLMSALSKWYMSAVILLAKAQPTPLSWNGLGVFAYREGLSCLDVLLPIQLILEAGSEWKTESTICLASCDVFAAFDNLTVEQAGTDMIASGMHPQMVAAITQENIDLLIQPEFPDCPDVRHMPFNKSIRQGGVESPFCWNRTVQQALSILVPSWKVRGLGVILDDGFSMSHAVWADNFYLISSSPQSLQVMIQELYLNRWCCGVYVGSQPRLKLCTQTARNMSHYERVTLEASMSSRLLKRCRLWGRSSLKMALRLAL